MSKLKVYKSAFTFPWLFHKWHSLSCHIFCIWIPTCSSNGRMTILGTLKLQIMDNMSSGEKIHHLTLLLSVLIIVYRIKDCFYFYLIKLVYHGLLCSSLTSEWFAKVVEAERGYRETKSYSLTSSLQTRALYYSSVIGNGVPPSQTDTEKSSTFK